MFEAKKAEAGSAIEAIMLLLATPYLQKGATRELRLGISRAFVAFTRGLSQPLLERHQEFLVNQLLTMLALPTPGRQAYETISHALRAGLGEPLSERGQAAMATSLAQAGTARNAADATVVVCLKEVSMLLISLREVAPSAVATLLAAGLRPGWRQRRTRW